MTGPPRLAVIVLSYRAPPELAEAVRSLRDQDILLEIVVVNSGGGGAREQLAQAGIEVPVIACAERLYAGAARNRGVAATNAPYVAFLASDCRATPGWAAARLKRHLAGASAVGSALVPADPDSMVAWASHLSLHARRLPGLSRLAALAYGASYDRALFARHGLFREDLRTGEDTEFHRRLPPSEQPHWAPEVRTIHRTPTNLGVMLADQFARGRRAGQSWRGMKNRPPFFLARIWWRRIADPIRLSRRAIRSGDLGPVRKAWLLLPLAASAYCLGALWPRRGA